MNETIGGYGPLSVDIDIGNTQVWTFRYQWHHMQLFKRESQKLEPDGETEGSHQAARSHEANKQKGLNSTND